MTNQFIRKFYDSGANLGMIGGAIQAAWGIAQSIGGSIKAKRLQQQIKAYQTPDEIYKILNASQNLASGGYDASTLDYLTNQTDQAFNSSASIAKRLGADANTLSSLFNDKINSVMRIGAENHALNMENFSKYLSALDTVASNKAAEQESRQNIIRDQLQAANQTRQEGAANISGGINTTLSAWSANRTNKLFTADATKTNTTGTTGNGGGGLSQDMIDMLIKELLNKKITYHN